jgi:dTDP-4-amino-4,6-dideoxygalactose transaminase
MVSEVTAEMSTWPHFDEDEIAAVERVLRSGKVNYWTGDQCRLFEEEYARYCRVPHAIALANGTVGLELALHALRIGPGDEVIVPSRTFVATANAVVTRGATPVFADVDADSQVLTGESIERVITPRTKAVIPVHLAGWPCDMSAILEVATRRRLAVIEDCAQAHGAAHHGRPVGSEGHVGVFSFCQDKIITTGGEGGLLVTADRDVWERAWAYKDHGKSYEKVHARRPSNDTSFRWVHDSIGTNFRMTEIQAAIGRVQLGKLDAWVERRRTHAALLNRLLKEVPALRTTEPGAHLKHSYYKYYVFIRPERMRAEWSRDRIVSEVNARGARCFSGSCSEIYLEGAYREAGIQPPDRLPVAKALGETSLMLEVHPTLSEQEVTRHASVLRDVVQEATGR